VADLLAAIAPIVVTKEPKTEAAQISTIVSTTARNLLPEKELEMATTGPYRRPRIENVPPLEPEDPRLTVRKPQTYIGQE